MAVALTEILRYRPPRVREETTAELGMLIFLGSWAMLFAGLFFAYGLVRTGAHGWPPKGLPRLPLALPALNSAVILGSSALLQWGLVRLRRGQRAATMIFGAFLLGVAFLALQCVVWVRLWHEGLLPTGGAYPSVFYGLTVFHALHVLVGLFALAALALGAARGIYNAGRHLPVRLWAMYWHFVGAAWIILFTTVYAL